jgi:hypothetical protein
MQAASPDAGRQATSEQEHIGRPVIRRADTAAQVGRSRLWSTPLPQERRVVE